MGGGRASSAYPDHTPDLVPSIHSFHTQVREVEVQREGNGGLGLCVKGGAEHRLPVLISRIIKNQAADRCKQLLVGDAILRVSMPRVAARCVHTERLSQSIIIVGVQS